MQNHLSDVENWGNFLQPLLCTNIKDQKYQCNNPAILIPLTQKIIKSYIAKDKIALLIDLSDMLLNNQIDLTNENYFVKLSSISGKDVIATEDYCEDITEFWQIMNAQNKKLIIKSVDELCEYLLTSERIAEYIQHDKYIVFRKWITYNVEEEFRCFIKNKKLVAISQYEYGNYLPQHMNCPKLICKLIKHFINQVIQHIPFDDIVIDIAMHMENLNVYFIEFNYFGLESDTDAGLYDWANDESILCCDHDDVDIRLYDPKWIEAKYAII